MLQGRPIALLLPEDPLAKRPGIFALLAAVGAWTIYVGRLNVRARYAEDTGGRAIFRKLLGKSTAIQGRWAVLTGWLRIVIGTSRSSSGSRTSSSGRS
jgi:hypothetical protein